jgi:hypothetical protein
VNNNLENKAFCPRCCLVAFCTESLFCCEQLRSSSISSSYQEHTVASLSDSSGDS